MTSSNANAVLQSILQKADSDLTFDTSQFERFCVEVFDGTSEDNVECSPTKIFRSYFDIDNDGKLGSVEKRVRVKKWLRAISGRKPALIVVDVQNDFIGGTLSIKMGPAHQDPETIIAPINRLIDTVPFRAIVYTFDWHPPDHISFIENINLRSVIGQPNSTGTCKAGDTVQFTIDGRRVKQRIWPHHCVQNTTGADLHPNLRTTVSNGDRVIKIYKGQDSNVDSYSAFFDNERKGKTALRGELEQRGITDVYVCGLAYDVCVAWTAEDAVSLGYNTAIIDDCCRGLDDKEIQSVKENIRKRNGVVMESVHVLDLVNGKRIPWKWAVAIAQRLFH